MKKAFFSSIIFCGIVLLLVFIVPGCQGAAQNDSLTKETVTQAPQGSEIQDKYTVALVMKTLTNPFFVEMEKGARQAEKDFNVNLIVQTGAQETSIEQQIQIVEELILQKVDAIVIAPGSSVELVQVLKKAQDAGIVIVNVDNRLDKAECEKQNLTGVPFISVKNDDAAYQSVKYMMSLSQGPQKAVVLEGIRDAENAELRKEGAMKAFKENPQIQVVASESANWKIDEAYSLSKQLFERYPDTGMVFCANDMMALGVVQYLKEEYKRNVLLAGFDNLEDAQKAIQEGWMDVTIDQQAIEQGYRGVESAVQMLEGSRVDSEIYIPVKLITSSDVGSES